MKKKQQIMKSFFIYTLILCVVFSPLKGQQIQWAYNVEFQYNQFDDELWSAKQVLGTPDAFPLGQLNEKAFRLKDVSGYGKITVGFKKPMPISQLIIVENYLPGRISKIIATDTQGNEHIIFEPRQEVFNILYRIQTINVEKTDYSVAKISLHLNSFNNLGWTQIDAIGIASYPIDSETLSKIEDKGIEGHHEKIKFAEQKEELSKSINSINAELKPILAPNGKTLYFVRKYDPRNTGGVTDEQDIYYSEFINGRWTEAQNIGAPLNDRLPNGICSISPDGNTIWVINGYNKDGSVEHGISVSHKVMGAWTGPLNLNIRDFYNMNDYQDYSMSADNKTLLMAIEREDSYGQLDFYVSFNKDSYWSAPMNLGNFINTPGIEYAPFLSTDTKTLYFSSNGYNKNGDSDVYYCKRLDDTWLNWTAPESMGPEINTDGWDSYFTMSANSKDAYFVSSPGNGTSNLMASTIDNIYKIPLDLEPLNKITIVFTGTVIDKNTKKPVEAQMYYTQKSISDLPEAVRKSSIVNGGFNLNLEPGLDYDIKIESQGYFDILSSVDLKALTKNEIIKQNFELTPIKVGETFRLDNIHFVQGEADILPESKPALEELIKIMVTNPTLVIELQGHTDTFGSKNANLRLSLERADAIKDFLLANGISNNKVKTSGFGDSKPISSNATEETRRFNRRVEVKVLKL